MRRFAVLALVLLASACVPPFTVRECVESCSQCGIDSCDAMCDLLQDGLESACAAETQEAWNCAIASGCDFPEVCSEEIGAFLICE